MHLARQLGLSIVRLKPTDLQDKMHGGDAARVEALYQVAAMWQPLVVTLDEADMVWRSKGNSVQKQTVGMWKTYLSDVDVPGLLLVATTNYRDAIEEAIQDRLQRQMHVGRPSQDKLKRIWTAKLQEGKFTAPPDQLQRLIGACPNLRHMDGLLARLNEQVTAMALRGEEDVSVLTLDAKNPLWEVVDKYCAEVRSRDQAEPRGLLLQAPGHDQVLAAKRRKEKQHPFRVAEHHGSWPSKCSKPPYLCAGPRTDPPWQDD